MQKNHCMILGILVGAGGLYLLQKSTGKAIPAR